MYRPFCFGEISLSTTREKKEMNRETREITTFVVSMCLCKCKYTILKLTCVIPYVLLLYVTKLQYWYFNATDNWQ
ncbi:hypothetical protein L6452_26527 [Arctium lappa]|uniref:Uncharacterized protein n=1 Tax=Arctium lappa TaxID=4217 RepID=A0ACB8ZVP1_ARCLA|nr:hypothetical protein L6452_26527 [Arctium lappa]